MTPVNDWDFHVFEALDDILPIAGRFPGPPIRLTCASHLWSSKNLCLQFSLSNNFFPKTQQTSTVQNCIAPLHCTCASLQKSQQIFGFRVILLPTKSGGFPSRGRKVAHRFRTKYLSSASRISMILAWTQRYRPSAFFKRLTTSDLICGSDQKEVVFSAFSQFQ